MLNGYYIAKNTPKISTIKIATIYKSDDCLF
nr:MAG TPA: hypothetical protein [Caudoviricetes sp.]DAZ22737.1 MAG TPA: hypothetical protein [Caudoviricetes sp.]